MARTYIPTSVIEVHKLYKFMARYQSQLRAAIVAVDPDYGEVFDLLFTSLAAFDALNQSLYPLQD